MKVKYKRLLIAGVFTFVVVAFSYVMPTLPKVFVWNTSGSIPIGLYLLVPPQNLAAGDVVVYSPTLETKALCIARGWTREGHPDDDFIKIIGAMEGQTYEIMDNHQFYANEKYYGQVSAIDSQGRKLPELPHGIHEVPAGYFLPLGNNPFSFDGKYTGPIPVKNIKAKALSVFTFD